MISSSRERGFQAKQEGSNINDDKISKPASSSRQWSGFSNPRIVRVSRSFGGKDRHSKVCTIRGLRDRRIRLSVPTAVQLYDLQDKLGLGQPSKVIDWLLDATKHDIDKLPPLQMPQGFGTDQFYQQMMVPHESNAAFAPFFDANSTFLKDGGGFHNSSLSGKEGIKINGSFRGEDELIMAAKAKYWDMDFSLRTKGKEVERENVNVDHKGKWIKTNDHNQDGILGDYSGHSSAHQKFFPIANNHQTSFPSLMNNAMGFNPYYHYWDPSNLSLSQFGSHGYISQAENSLNGNIVPSTLPLPSGSQLFFCPPVPATIPSLFPTYTPYVTTPGPGESTDSRYINHFQFLSSSSQQILPNSLTINSSSTLRPLQLNINPGVGDMQNNNEIQPEKGDS